LAHYLVFTPVGNHATWDPDRFCLEEADILSLQAREWMEVAAVWLYEISEMMRLIAMFLSCYKGICGCWVGLGKRVWVWWIAV